MTRTVFWGPTGQGLEDGVFRRRALIPAAGLRALGWRFAGDLDLASSLHDIDAAVLDASSPDCGELVRQLSSSGASLVLDAARALAEDRDAAIERLAGWTGPGRSVVVGSQADAAFLEERLSAPIRFAPDAVETPTALQLAAQMAGAAYRPDKVSESRERTALWLASPEDDAVGELEWLASILDDLDIAGLSLEIMAPEPVLETAMSIAPRAAVRAWSLEGQFAAIQAATGLVLPPDGGARRAATARALGIPVLRWPAPEGSRSPADLAALATESEVDVGGGAPSLDAALTWDEVLNDALRAPVFPSHRRPIRVLMFLDLVQDTELCLPIARAAMSSEDVELRVVMTTWLNNQTPTAAESFRALGIQPEFVDREGAVLGKRPDLSAVDAVLTPVATNLKAHARADSVVQRAKVARIPTFSLQHGLENVGLSYFDERHSERVEISTDHLFLWSAPDFAPPAAPDLRRKYLHVGLVKEPPSQQGAPALSDGAPVVAVFENLHWHRYDDRFRRQFIDDLKATAAAFPNHQFVLKPHHAGLWAAKVGVKGGPNLRVLDPRDPQWEPFTAPALIQRADLVITSPSTVALDAALAGRPVAVAGYQLDLPIYEPLPILRTRQDWFALIDQAADPGFHESRQESFVRRRCMRQGASPRLVEMLVDIVRAAG